MPASADLGGSCANDQRNHPWPEEDPGDRRWPGAGGSEGHSAAPQWPTGDERPPRAPRPPERRAAQPGPRPRPPQGPPVAGDRRPDRPHRSQNPQRPAQPPPGPRGQQPQRPARQDPHGRRMTEQRPGPRRPAPGEHPPVDRAARRQPPDRAPVHGPVRRRSAAPWRAQTGSASRWATQAPQTGRATGRGRRGAAG